MRKNSVIILICMAFFAVNHDAAPDSRFTHIGITPKVSENSAEWLGEVTDTEYAEAVK